MAELILSPQIGFELQTSSMSRCVNQSIVDRASFIELPENSRQGRLLLERPSLAKVFEQLRRHPVPWKRRPSKRSPTMVLLGLGVVPVGLTLRASLPDGLHGRRPLPPAIWRPLLARPGRLVAATLVIASGTVAFSVGGLMTSYALLELHCSPAIAYLAAASLGVSTIVIAPLGGRLADRLGGRIAVVLSRLSLALLGWPAFMWLTGGGGSTALLAVSAGLAAASTLGTPAAFCLIADSVPPASHATGLALVYALGISLFGGATQPAAVALLAWTGDPRSTAWLLVGAGIIGTVATLLLPRQSAWPAVRNPVAPAPGSQRTSA
jgi:hypothetical protein